MRICTIVARNYLAYARVLAESYLAQDPNGECVVLVIDDVEGRVDDVNEPFSVMRPHELELERFAAMAGMYDVTELATAVKPWLLEHLLAEDRGPVAYFDPDIRFYAPVEQIERSAVEHELVLIPHITAPLPEDGKQPGELDLMASGTYNLGFIAMAPGERTAELLRWWQRRLRYDCVIDHALGYFVDQRWFDLVPNTFEGTAILRDPGMNVAYWNLHERRVSKGDDGRWLVNGEPLRFFHFSGFDISEPHTLSKHQTRTRLSDHPDLAVLCRQFADEVQVNVRAGERGVPYAWDRLGDGRIWNRRLRRLYRDGERAGAFELSPFDAHGAAEFTAWLNEPALEAAAPTPISRFWFDVYRERADLQAIFPDLSKDVDEFLRWIDGYGHEMGDVRGLMPPGRATAGGQPATASPSGAEEEGKQEPLGVNVAGFLQSELGIGEAARGVISALDSAGVPLLPVHGRWRPSSRQGHSYTMFDTDAAIFPINLVCVNADVLSHWAAQAGESFFASRYTIGFWWWEVLAFPQDWLPAFDLVDEVWVASQHVADALMPVTTVPLTKVTMPVAAPAFTYRSRHELGLPEGFLFLFLFDHHSVFERKNPLAIMEAFKRAFPPGAGASLVIKSINHEHHQHAHERLLLAARQHPDIHVIDRYVSAREKNAMIAGCDCYVSLHRTEGFGLTLAEAMCLGKPVIATRYGGNLEFMNDRNSWLVDCSMVPIGDGQAPYPSHGEWAQPDLDQAAAHMLEIFTGAGDASERASRGQAYVLSRHSPEAAGATMVRRLEHIHARHGGQPRRPTAGSTTPDLGRMHELLAGPRPPAHSPLGRIGRLMRRVVLRLMKPFTAHQQMVNVELGRVLESLTDASARTSAAARSERLREGRQTAAQLGELRRQRMRTEELTNEVEKLRADLRRARLQLQALQVDKTASSTEYAGTTGESELGSSLKASRFGRPRS